MRKFGFVLALVVLSAAVWASSASAISSPQVFNLLAVDSQNGQPINGFMFDRQPRPGDQFAITENLYKWAGTKKGARVGHDQGIATFLTVGANGGTGLFTVQAYLQGGSVLVQGISTFPEAGTANFKLPVIGGTGKYANVGGYVSVRDLGNGNQNKSNLEFHLQP